MTVEWFIFQNFSFGRKWLNEGRIDGQRKASFGRMDNVEREKEKREKVNTTLKPHHTPMFN